MAIVSYLNENNETRFKVRIVRKSVDQPGVQVEKRVKNIANETEAKKIERKLNLEAERELFQKLHKGCLWGSLVDQWEVAAKAGDVFSRKVSKGTVDEYVEVIRTHASQWENRHISEINRVEAWTVLDKVDREVSQSRRKRLRSAIDAVFSWGVLSGRIKESNDSPTAGYKSNRKEEEKIPEILTLTEIRTLLKSAKQYDHGWYPVWAMALFTGMRSGELFALKWQHLDFENKLIYVHENWTNKEGFGPTKGRYWRTVPIESEEVLGFLKELRAISKIQFVLPRFQSWEEGGQAEILRKFCIGIGIPSIKFHTLRACFATQLIRDGVAPAVIMKICGWKDLKTMQRYIRLAGIEVKGATQGLKLLPEVEVMGRVVELFNRT